MRKSIMTVLVIMMLAFTASAYVPEQYRTSEQMSEYDIVKSAMKAHDAGDNSRWVVDTLDEASIHNTNGGRISGDYFALRVWLSKIEAQRSGIFPGKYIQPGNEAGPDNAGKGLCRGYDEYCKREVT